MLQKAIAVTVILEQLRYIETNTPEHQSVHRQLRKFSDVLTAKQIKASRRLVVLSSNATAAQEKTPL